MYNYVLKESNCNSWLHLNYLSKSFGRIINFSVDERVIKAQDFTEYVLHIWFKNIYVCTTSLPFLFDWWFVGLPCKGYCPFLFLFISNFILNKYLCQLYNLAFAQKVTTFQLIISFLKYFISLYRITVCLLYHNLKDI